MSRTPTARTWFTRAGWAWRPSAAAGWIVTALVVAAIAWVFVVVDRRSHSVSDTLITTFVYATCLAVWWAWIASNTSRGEAR